MTTTQPDRDAAEAFVGVLACARAADGTFPEVERDLLHLICRNHPFTRQLGDEGYRQAARRVKQRLDDHGWEASLERYLNVLPAAWGDTTILSVIDICLIDADEDGREITCIAHVADRFAIPASVINDYMQIFRIKNGMHIEAVAATQRAS